jgi:4-hydroxyphenylpyruvate dioxygenase
MPVRRTARWRPGSRSVDHVSQSMQHEEMLTWLLFYMSLLDVCKNAEQDVLDPGGIVNSQVVQTADGACGSF